jgi:hypothetical protein
MNPKIIGAAPAAAELAEVDSECTPIPIESQVTRGAWTREIEELCRALEAQRRSHLPSIDPEKK